MLSLARIVAGALRPASAFLLLAGAAAAQTVTPFCFGDGTGSVCQCGNVTPLGAQQGCMNSYGQGSRLSAAGVASTRTDTLVLTADHLPTTTTIIFFQGTTKQNAGFGSALGDGLLCTNGALLRLSVKTAVGGVCAYGFGIGTDPLVSVAGSIGRAGGRRYYQGWYRNNASFCMPEGYNFSSALSVDWVP